MPQVPLNMFLAWRLQSAIGRRHYISLVTGLGLGALALVVATLIVVSSVMNGFESQIRARIFAALPHVEIEVEPEFRSAASLVLENLRQRPEVKELIPFRDARVMLSRDERLLSARMRGIQPQPGGPSPLAVLEPRDWRLVLDLSTALALGVGIGDVVEVSLPKASISPLGIFTRSRPFTVAAIVDGGARSEPIATAHVEDLLRLAPDSARLDKWELRLEDPLNAEAFLDSAQASLAPCCRVDSWRQRSGPLFDALALERTMVSLMLGLVVLIALLNLASTLRLMVEERKSDIAMLRLHGASADRLFSIFALQGFMLGGVGVTLGVILGLPLAAGIDTLTLWTEAWLFNSGLPAVHLPSTLRWDHIAMIAGGMLLACLPAVLIPASRALSSGPLSTLK